MVTGSDADATAKQVWEHLARRDIASACTAALQGRNPRLATLLAQAGSCAEFMAYLHQQSDAWAGRCGDVYCASLTCCHCMWRVLLPLRSGVLCIVLVTS